MRRPRSAQATVGEGKNNDGIKTPACTDGARPLSPGSKSRVDLVVTGRPGRFHYGDGRLGRFPKKWPFLASFFGAQRVRAHSAPSLCATRKTRPKTATLGGLFPALAISAAPANKNRHVEAQLLPEPQLSMCLQS